MNNPKAELVVAALDQMQLERPVKNIVEVGTTREFDEVPSDGWATVYIARWAAQHRGIKVVSIDTDRRALDVCGRVLDQFKLRPLVDLRLGDGAAVLAELDAEGGPPIDLLYLDGSNDPAEALSQFEAAYDQLHTGATVLVDDAVRYRGNRLGKATDVLPAALERGWFAVLVDTYSTRQFQWRTAVLRRTRPLPLLR